MTTFTDTQAKQQLDDLLRIARSQGEARIRTPDGQEYAVRPLRPNDSPFDVAGVSLGLTGAEIVAFVREGREK